MTAMAWKDRKWTKHTEFAYYLELNEVVNALQVAKGRNKGQMVRCLECLKNKRWVQADLEHMMNCTARNQWQGRDMSWVDLQDLFFIHQYLKKVNINPQYIKHCSTYVSFAHKMKKTFRDLAMTQYIGMVKDEEWKRRKVQLKEDAIRDLVWFQKTGIIPNDSDSDESYVEKEKGKVSDDDHADVKIVKAYGMMGKPG